MRPLDDRVRDEITPLVQALGFTLIDVTVFRGKGARSVKLVIYRKDWATAPWRCRHPASAAN